MVKSNPNAFGKVAVVHDTLVEYGGSERVLEEILKIFPSCDFYTFYYNKKNPVISSAFDKYRPRSSFFSSMPFLANLGPYFSVMKIFSSIYFMFLNLTKYDLIISSSHSFNCKIVSRGAKATHVCYLHTPPRYLYSEFNELGFVKKFPINMVLFPVFWFLRYLDRVGSLRPDVIMVNSKAVQKRVRKYYLRPSIVINPPYFLWHSQKKQVYKTKGAKKYYLFVSRLVGQKGVELVVKAANIYNFPLTVVGSGYLLPRLKRMALGNVNFVGRVSDKILDQLYFGAKALLWAARDEDFGIVPVEAIAHKVPVIAYRQGGVTETVSEGKTGVFFKNFSPQGLYQAMLKASRIAFSDVEFTKKARSFSAKEFRRKLISVIKKQQKGIL